MGDVVNVSVVVKLVIESNTKELNSFGQSDGLPPTLMGRIVQFLFQVNMTILVLSALMLSPLVSHNFSIVLMVFCVRCQMTPVSLPSASGTRSSANAWR